MRRIVLPFVFALVVMLSLVAPAAWGVQPGPGWQIFERAEPTNFSVSPINGFSDGYQILVRNSGSKGTDGTPVTVFARMPTGVTPTGVKGFEIGPGFQEPFITSPTPQKPVALECVRGGTETVTCKDNHPVPAGDTLLVDITVKVSGEVPEGEDGSSTASVLGGGAASQTTSLATHISASPLPFGLESASLDATGVDGLLDTQAGDHLYEFTTTFYLNTRERGSTLSSNPSAGPVEDTRDVVTDLPAGFVGDPQVVQKCPQILAQLEPPGCPPSTQIGVAHLDLFGLEHNPTAKEFTVPIYNVVPDKGVAAQFVFTSNTPIMLYVNVSHDTNYAVRVTVSGIPRIAEITGVSLTFFGEPFSNRNIDNKSVGATPAAFLQNPVDCSAGPLRSRVSVDSWEKPASYLPDGSPNLADPNWKTFMSTMYPSMSGCDMLQFDPQITVTPDTTQADEPAGVTVDLHVPQSVNRFPALATPELKDATVTLPAGMSISPAAADGLAGCSDAQIGLESTEPAGCPNASVLGTVKIHTPLLENMLEGQVFLGTPECDPCSSADAADGHELRLFIEASGDGVRIKKEGRIYVNPSTGQLTTKFEENPELPFEDLELHFNGGLRAGLATPQSCGQVTTTSDLVPWSTPITPDANPTSSFDVDWDGNGGVCPAVAPFSPSFSAGTSNPNAGQYSPLTLTFGREDREQDLAAIQVHMAAGLLGTLSGIPLCGEPQASLGTCGEASRIGSMTVAAGAGSHPFYEKGEVYLTGPYKGAPFGLSIVVPTVAGPFNLGNVVVRAMISVDLHTTALTVTSDPFPQIIDGIPLRLRAANVTIDHPGFIFNPTNCAQLKISATITGAQGAQAQVSAPFAVAGCVGLHFGPTFKAYTAGKTSRSKGASLDVKLTLPQGAQSNISHVKVDLPKDLPSRLTTLQKACPATTFNANPAECPRESIVGVAKAISPLLPVPLNGPAYFVSHAGEEFPNLIVVLQGYGVRLDLIGDTFINGKTDVTSSTFTNVPDVPVRSFELYLPQGKYSALAANGNLCKQKLLMPTLFTAQDGARIKQSTLIQVTGCPKATVSKKTKRKAKKATASRHAGTNGRTGR